MATGGKLNLDDLRNELGGVVYRAIGRDDPREQIATELRQIADRLDEETRPLWSR